MSATSIRTYVHMIAEGYIHRIHKNELLTIKIIRSITEANKRNVKLVRLSDNLMIGKLLINRWVRCRWQVTTAAISSSYDVADGDSRKEWLVFNFVGAKDIIGKLAFTLSLSWQVKSLLRLLTSRGSDWLAWRQVRRQIIVRSRLLDAQQQRQQRCSNFQQHHQYTLDTQLSGSKQSSKSESEKLDSC